MVMVGDECGGGVKRIGVMMEDERNAKPTF